MRVALVAALGVAAPACRPASPDARVQSALGEPQDGFPSWEERVLHVLSNRARAAPAADLAACPMCADAACYTSSAPLVLDHALNRSARFHSANLRLSGCFQHPSPCTLVSDITTQYTPGSCNGAPSCACVGGAAVCGSTGTGVTARMALFGGSGSAENIAYQSGTPDPQDVFYQWLWEDEPSATCGFRLSNGHRYNILNPALSKLGAGADGTMFTQDFGSGGTPSKIVGGVHHPKTGSTIDFRANWYAAAPQAAAVNVDGACSAMAVERGTASNGTYLATLSMTGGCHHYVFAFVDGSGAAVSFPSTGAFGIGCAADWDATRPADCAVTDAAAEAAPPTEPSSEPSSEPPPEPTLDAAPEAVAPEPPAEPAPEPSFEPGPEPAPEAAPESEAEVPPEPGPPPVEPPQLDAPPADAPPALDAPPPADAPPVADAPLPVDAPPAADAPPVADAPLAADAPLPIDPPPVVDAPPATDTSRPDAKLDAGVAGDAPGPATDAGAARDVAGNDASARDGASPDAGGGGGAGDGGGGSDAGRGDGAGDDQGPPGAGGQDGGGDGGRHGKSVLGCSCDAGGRRDTGAPWLALAMSAALAARALRRRPRARSARRA